MDTVIYSLVDPRTGAIRYVGQTRHGKRRSRRHGAEAVLRRDPNKHKVNWIRQLQDLGLTYEVRLLSVLSPGVAQKDLDEEEKLWIGSRQG